MQFRFPLPLVRLMTLLIGFSLLIVSCNKEEELDQLVPQAPQSVEAFLEKEVNSPEDFPAFQRLSEEEKQMILDLSKEEMQYLDKAENEVEDRLFFRNRDILIFKAAIIVSGLWQEVLGEKVTAFAPSNAAFLELGIVTLIDLLSMPQGELRTILEYHIIPDERFFSFQLEDGFQPTINGAGIEIDVDSEGIFVNETEVTRANIFDILFFNGVVHRIDGILIPPSQNIVELAVSIAASDDPEFTQLVAAVVEADLVEALSDDGPFTVLAPTDEAFEALLEALGLDSIDEIDLATLEAVLLYHVIPARVFSSDLEDGPVETLNGIIEINGSDLTIDDNGSEVDANIVATDVQATNGVVHVIDKVLLP